MIDSLINEEEYHNSKHGIKVEIKNPRKILYFASGFAFHQWRRQISEDLVDITVTGKNFYAMLDTRKNPWEFTEKRDRIEQYHTIQELKSAKPWIPFFGMARHHES